MDSLGPVPHAFPQVVLVELAQGLCLIPLPDELIDAMTSCKLSEALPPSYYLTDRLEAQFLLPIGDKAVGYLEAEYFGGQGTQAAVLWQGGQPPFVSGPEYGTLNAVLRSLGVRLSTADEDEFDAFSLCRHRHTNDWVATRPTRLHCLTQKG